MWKQLDSVDNFKFELSQNLEKVSLIFKHSSRCFHSEMALQNLDKAFDDEAKDLNFYLIDVLKSQELATYVAKEYAVAHASPQALLIKGGDCLLELEKGEIVWQTIYEELAYYNLLSGN